ncbi:MAG: ribosome recycling factor [Deltaproteobacteria bacterium]|nr:ribosome recycling factor [Deltaproteobacteria bacterium]
MAEDPIKNILADHSSKCAKSLEAFKRDLAKVRTGRASSGLVEGIVVEYYGAKMPVNQLAQITTPEARLIVLQVYDMNAVSAVQKAIQASGLGFNPSSEGNLVRIVVPALTEDSRKDLIKHLHKMAEEIKVSIRNHRRDANDAIKKHEKDGTVSKDASQRSQESVQKQTDSSIAQVDKGLTAKEAEIMEV